MSILLLIKNKISVSLVTNLTKKKHLFRIYFFDLCLNFEKNIALSIIFGGIVILT